MGSVSLRGVEKSYGSVRAIRGVDLEIADGEFVALVGPSGCGKSTLLRMIAGLEDISGGEIAIAGEVVNDLTPRERNIAMVFQNYALYPHMSVRDNMGFSLKLAGMPQTEARGRIARAAGILGLDDFLARFPAQLSGGQRQRVAMGRAIVRDTRVFLFDEPLSNLDAQLRVQMRGEIKQLHQRLGNTTVYVTHDQIEAMTMADRIVVMRDGIVEQAGAPLELYDNPVNTFVARFIGSPAMNLLPATVRRGPAGPVAEVAPGVAMPLPQALPAAMEGRAVIWGLRPEHVERDEDGFALEVELVEPTGSETHVVLATGAEAPLVAVFRDRIAPAPGSRIGLSPRPDKALLFDEASGARLWTPAG